MNTESKAIVCLSNTQDVRSRSVVTVRHTGPVTVVVVILMGT